MKLKVYATLARKTAIVITLFVLIGIGAFASFVGNPASAAQKQQDGRRGKGKVSEPANEELPQPRQEPIPQIANMTTAQSAAPEQTTELKLDDGSGEAGLLQDGLIMLNRFTPTSYPVKLDRVKFAFARFTNQPDPTGQAIKVFIYLDPSGSGTLPANPQFTQLNTTVPGTSLTTFFNLNITNGPTITAGDIYVGYQAGTPHNGVGFLVDNNSTNQSRTYFSTNNGSSFSRLAPATGAASANAMIRAEVSVPAQGTAPTLTSVSPSSFTAGAKGLLTLTGTGFAAVPRVLLNGRALETFFVNATTLSVVLLADAIPVTGSYSLKVVNPDNGESNTLNLTVGAAASDAETEPNHALQSADALPIPGRRTGTAAKGDPFTLTYDYSASDRDGIEDFFAFQLTQPTNVELLLTQTASITQADLDLLLFREVNGQLQEVATSNFDITFSEIPVERISLPLPAGRYFVGVSAYFGSSAYTLTSVIPALVPLSAASFNGYLSNDFIGTLFGAKLATDVVVSTGTTLPTTLGGTTVKLRDSAGRETALSLFFVAPSQINYWIPPTVALGLATVTVTSGDGTVTTGTTIIYRAAPGLFSANGFGSGPAAAFVFHLKANGAQSLEPISGYTAARGHFTVPIDFGESTDQLFLILYGTGFRGSRRISEAKLEIGGVNVPLPYIGPQGQFLGLDQINVGPLPRNLAGRGEVDIEFTDGFDFVNVVKVNFK